MTDPNPPIPENAVAALRKGDRIEAIALTKSAGGLDLTEAKQSVDAHLEANPQTMKRALSERSTGGVIIVLIILGFAVAIAYVLFKGSS